MTAEVGTPAPARGRDRPHDAAPTLFEPGRGRGMTLAGDRVYLAYIRAFVPFRGTWSGVVALDQD